MSRPKKKYEAPALTEVKFEDQNLVMFASCSKQTKISDNITSGCCELLPEQTPAAIFDPS